MPTAVSRNSFPLHSLSASGRCDVNNERIKSNLNKMSPIKYRTHYYQNYFFLSKLLGAV